VSCQFRARKEEKAKENMVCDSCTERLGRLCVPDKWKEGATNTGSLSLPFLSLILHSSFLVAGGGVKAGKTNKVRKFEIERRKMNIFFKTYPVL
jgi:hypothetical protein